MTEREMKFQNNSWMLLLCVVAGPVGGCDASEDFDQTILLAELEDGSVPLVAGDVPFGDSLTLASAPAPEVPTSIPAGVYPQRNMKPTEELMIGWLQWALGQPYATGPIADTTGENCGEGQSGPVWYLAGTFGGAAVRDCDVPAGKQLFFPLINRWCVFPPEFYPDEQSILDSLPWFVNYYASRRAATCELTLRIDGQDVRPDFQSLEQDSYIVINEPFEIDLHDQHWAVGYFEGGPLPMTGAGHYALIQPLPPGDHVIELGGKLCTNVPFETRVTYNLHVGP
jgi:hypothetical protein